MNHKDANALAEWITENTKGFARRDGEKIYLEGTIDAFELLRYAQSLPTNSSTGDIYAQNRLAYTGRDNDGSTNAVVEGADW